MGFTLGPRHQSLAKTSSEVAGQGSRDFCAGGVQSSNAGLSDVGSEQVFASRRESERSTPPVDPEMRQDKEDIKDVTGEGGDGEDVDRHHAAERT